MRAVLVFDADCRTPQGVRGLKRGLAVVPSKVGELSHSARSAWIETRYWRKLPGPGDVALRKECVD